MSNNRLERVRAIENETFREWMLMGTPEAYNALNEVNREVIKAYMAENSNALGYKFHKGIVNLKADELYNFCCDYVFNGTAENIEKVKAAEKTVDSLMTTLDEADGILFIWS